MASRNCCVGVLASVVTAQLSTASGYVVKELVGMKFLRIQEKRLKRVSKECMRYHTKSGSGMLGRCMMRVGFLERGTFDAHNGWVCFINYQMAHGGMAQRFTRPNNSENSERVCE